MKLQTALTSLLLIAILFASALASHSDDPTTHSYADSPSPFGACEVKSETIEVARQGFQIGQA